MRTVSKIQNALKERIRIGNQTAFSAHNITEPFRYAVTHGFDAFEWFPDKKESGAGWAEDDMGKRTRSLIKKIAFDHDMALSVHAPWQANPLEEKGLETLFSHVEFARDIGATLLNVHLYTDEGIEPYIQAIRPLIRHLKKNSIRLSIENTPTTDPEAFNELFARLQNSNPGHAGHIGMCLDPGHANLCQTTLNDYIKYIGHLDPKVPIFHVHMHENFGDHDSHLPLFTGPSGKDPSAVRGVLYRLVERRFSGSIILEQWPQPPSLLDAARDRLKGMLDDVRWEIRNSNIETRNTKQIQKDRSRHGGTNDQNNHC